MPAYPRLVSSIVELRAAFRELRTRAPRVGLVPTMGALHEGHLSLVRASRHECQGTVATIFVNPTQFGPREDFSKYPRTLPADLDLLGQEQVDLVFAPPADEIYRPDFSTYVTPPTVAERWEGQCRPGHFRGVATVVLKLFQLVPADVAYFGQKDYQQYLVIRDMARDLNVPVDVRRCPIVREPDGLAMSSRNRYLSPDERLQAVAVSRSLATGRQRFESGERSTATISSAMRQVLTDAGIHRIDYTAVVDPETLQEAEVASDSAVLLIAAYVGQTRLIDNCLVP